MEQRFEAVQREAQAAGGSGREAVQEHSGPSGYRWQRSYSRNGPGEAGVAAGCLGQRALGKGFLPGVPPPGGAACLGAPQLSTQAACILLPAPAGYQEYRSESFSVIGVPPHGHCGMVRAPPAALHSDPLSALGLLLAAALAGGCACWVGPGQCCRLRAA